MEEECFKFSLTQSGLFEIEDSCTNINEIRSHICMHNPNLHIGNKNFFYIGKQPYKVSGIFLITNLIILINNVHYQKLSF